MKAESNLQPKNKFEIENIIDGKCEIVFFDNIQELEPIEDEQKRYSFDIYRLKTNYRDELEQELNENVDKFKQWLQLAKDTEYNTYASLIRKQRNKLLQETDEEMVLDRLNLNMPESITTTTLLASVKEFFTSLKDISSSEMAKYRQALRDIPQQDGFPYEVEFPVKPNKEESK